MTSFPGRDGADFDWWPVAGVRRQVLKLQATTPSPVLITDGQHLTSGCQDWKETSDKGLQRPSKEEEGPGPGCPGLHPRDGETMEAPVSVRRNG